MCVYSSLYEDSPRSRGASSLQFPGKVLPLHIQLHPIDPSLLFCLIRLPKAGFRDSGLWIWGAWRLGLMAGEIDGWDLGGFGFRASGLLSGLFEHCRRLISGRLEPCHLIAKISHLHPRVWGSELRCSAGQKSTLVDNKRKGLGGEDQGGIPPELRFLSTAE